MDPCSLLLYCLVSEPQLTSHRRRLAGLRISQGTVLSLVPLPPSCQAPRSHGFDCLNIIRADAGTARFEEDSQNPRLATSPLPEREVGRFEGGCRRWWEIQRPERKSALSSGASLAERGCRLDGRCDNLNIGLVIGDRYTAGISGMLTSPNSWSRGCFQGRALRYQAHWFTRPRQPGRSRDEQLSENQR
jgi:hypothetical protein